MFLPWLTLFDFANIRSNFSSPIDLYNVKTRSENYALLVPIFNELKYLTNIQFLKRHAKHVILCTTDHETPEFVSSLEALAAEHGFRVSYSEVAGNVKNPWAIYYKTLIAHDSVLKSTIDQLTEKYVIFIDGDTYVDGDLALLCGAMEEHTLDISSVRVLPSNRNNVIEHLQGVEYDIAMRSRYLYPWLTSGAGMVARTTVMIDIMVNHSLFFNGGDVEIGKLADMMGYNVAHIPMVFYTDIPNTFGKWVRQRRSWMCGMFRHSVINWHHNIKHPFHFLYFSLIIYVLYPVKVAEMIQHPQLLPLILVLYALATYIANWKVRSRWMLIFPLYALFQVLVIIWLGIFRYFETVRRTGNWGRIRMVHNPREVYPTRYNWLRITTDLCIISLTSLAILLGTIEPIQQLIFGRHIDITYLVMEAGKAANEGITASRQALYEWSAQPQSTTGLLMSAFLALIIVSTILYLPKLLLNFFSQSSLFRRIVPTSIKLSRTLARINRAIELDPESASLFFQRGQFLAKQNDYQQSLNDYSRAIELHLVAPDQRQIPLQKSYSLINDDLALKGEEGESGSRQEFLAQLYRSRSDIYYEQFQILDAMNDALSAINLSPTLGDFYRIRILKWAYKQGTYPGIMKIMAS